jgi:hypothetical protein
MDRLPNPDIYSVIAFVITTLVTSFAAPYFWSALKVRIKSKESVSDIANANEEKEHEFEMKSLRLEYEKGILRENIRRLVSKVRRVVKYVRSKDPALEFILDDLEGEMTLLGLDDILEDEDESFEHDNL